MLAVGCWLLSSSPLLFGVFWGKSVSSLISSEKTFSRAGCELTGLLEELAWQGAQEAVSGGKSYKKITWPWPAGNQANGERHTRPAPLPATCHGWCAHPLLTTQLHFCTKLRTPAPTGPAKGHPPTQAQIRLTSTSAPPGTHKAQGLPSPQPRNICTKRAAVRPSAPTSPL